MSSLFHESEISEGFIFPSIKPVICEEIEFIWFIIIEYIYDIYFPFENGIQMKTENINIVLDGDLSITKYDNDDFKVWGDKTTPKKMTLNNSPTENYLSNIYDKNETINEIFEINNNCVEFSIDLPMTIKSLMLLSFVEIFRFLNP